MKYEFYQNFINKIHDDMQIFSITKYANFKINIIIQNKIDSTLII